MYVYMMHVCTCNLCFNSVMKPFFNVRARTHNTKIYVCVDVSAESTNLGTLLMNQASNRYSGHRRSQACAEAPSNWD